MSPNEHEPHVAVVGAGPAGAALAYLLARNGVRVTLLERTNIRALGAAALPAIPDLAVIDVSFISLRLVLPIVATLVAPGGDIVALVKPQFEVGKGQVGSGGVVRDRDLQRAAVAGVRAAAETLGLTVSNECESPILGPKGNREFFLAVSVPSV